jgi:hypothetical protein
MSMLIAILQAARRLRQRADFCSLHSVFAVTFASLLAVVLLSTLVTGLTVFPVGASKEDAIDREALREHKSALVHEVKMISARLEQSQVGQSESVRAAISGAALELGNLATNIQTGVDSIERGKVIARQNSSNGIAGWLLSLQMLFLFCAIGSAWIATWFGRRALAALSTSLKIAARTTAMAQSSGAVRLIDLEGLNIALATFADVDLEARELARGVVVSTEASNGLARSLFSTIEKLRHLTNHAVGHDVHKRVPQQRSLIDQSSERLVNAYQELFRKTDELADVVELAVGERGGMNCEVRDILDSIAQIDACVATSKQTASLLHVLSLNFRIETARENGVGDIDSMRSDELRGLAERTSHTARGIERQLGAIAVACKVTSEKTDRLFDAFIAVGRLLTSLSQAVATQRTGILALLARRTASNDMKDEEGVSGSDLIGLIAELQISALGFANSSDSSNVRARHFISRAVAT